ncbi:MAG: type II toxin-antitoxin system VapC family toxin [Acidobacteria bacterium]|nr:type II toxin-antitoxin system VapC family toxin [Acidobacteriota bacterium]
MKIVDANLLIYAVNRDAPKHREARAWWEKTLSGGERVGLCWMVLLAFVRLTTRTGLFRHPLSVKAAIGLVRSWLDEPMVEVVREGPEHVRIFEQMLASTGTGGNLTTDAYLAALAIERGAELCSCDADFARFSGLKWTNPLA